MAFRAFDQHFTQHNPNPNPNQRQRTRLATRKSLVVVPHRRKGEVVKPPE